MRSEIAFKLVFSLNAKENVIHVLIWPPSGKYDHRVFGFSLSSFATSKGDVTI